jgi:hypothetical protein
MLQLTEMDDRVRLADQLSQEVGPVILVNTFRVAPQDSDALVLGQPPNLPLHGAAAFGSHVAAGAKLGRVRSRSWGLGGGSLATIKSHDLCRTSWPETTTILGCVGVAPTRGARLRVHSLRRDDRWSPSAADPNIR